MRPAMLWPAAIVAVLALTVIANVAVLIAARDPHASAVEPDYYHKAVTWDSTLAAERRQAGRLGWRVDAQVLDASRAGAVVRVTVLDRDGAPLAGARVRVEAIHNLQADLPVRAVLRESGRGEYAARLPLALPGVWELRLEVVRGEDRITTSLRREARWPSMPR